MGQRQDQSDIEYGTNCLAGFPVGKTPKKVYVRFSKVIACPLAPAIPPNDRVFTLTQVPGQSCSWTYTGTGWYCGFRSFAPFVNYGIDLTTSPAGMAFFNAVHAMPFEEGLVYANGIIDCLGVHMGHHGFCIVTWRLESIDLLESLNLETASDLFMEMRPLENGSKVYKYCKLKDSTNVKILFGP